METAYIIGKNYLASFIARYNIKNFPIFIGTAMSMAKCLWIKRYSKENRALIIRQIKERCEQFMKDPDNVNPLIMMPEGA